MTCPCGNHAACVEGCALMDYPGYMVDWAPSLGSPEWIRRQIQQQDIMPRSLREQQAAGECCNKTRNVGAPCPIGRECPVEEDGFRTAYPEMPYSPPLPDVTRDPSDAVRDPALDNSGPCECGRTTQLGCAVMPSRHCGLWEEDPAPVPELVQEIDDWYAANDPLMAGAGDGNSPPWTEKTMLDGILEARGERYGKFADNANVAQNIKASYRFGKNYCELAHDQIEALEQIAAKISRIVTGDPDYVDNWDDIAGYAKLVAERLREEQAA